MDGKFRRHSLCANDEVALVSIVMHEYVPLRKMGFFGKKWIFSFLTKCNSAIEEERHCFRASNHIHKVLKGNGE